MSCWTHIRGTITVSPMGMSQPEKKYVLDTVLAHLPKVTGSEDDINTYVIQKNGYNSSCTHDEFGQYSNLGNDNHFCGRPVFGTQDSYIIVVDAGLRDRTFPQTMREFSNWLCRLSKRVLVHDVLVEVSEPYDKSYLFRNDSSFYSNMYEFPSWMDGNGVSKANWCESMMGLAKPYFAR